jgi:hypothetical protein
MHLPCWKIFIQYVEVKILPFETRVFEVIVEDTLEILVPPATQKHSFCFIIYIGVFSWEKSQMDAIYIVSGCKCM